MNYLLGTDIGTSGTKTILMDTDGNLIAQDLQEYDVLTPKPLWAEQWPSVWLDAAKASIKNTVLKSGIPPENIRGIAVSGLYGGSGIPLDENMEPVRPCMIWMDRRAEKEANWVLESIGKEKLLEVTHNGADPYYGYTKILWMKNNEPENWRKTKLFLPPNDYVIYKLTGEVVIDYSSAGNIGGIFDMNNRAWSKEMMAAMDIPFSMMPEKIVESTDIVGGLTIEAAAELGLTAGMPVIASGIDCGAATIGLGVFDSGIYAAAIGTSMCAALISDKPVQGKDLIVWPYLYDAKRLSYYFAGGATAGAIVKWFRQTLCQFELEAEKAGGKNAYDVLNEQAANIPAGSDGLVVLPYFMGERSPIWDSDAKGTIVGLSLAHTKAHMYRAFLEAVAFSLRDAIEATGEYLGEYILLAGGVTKSKLWRQIFADVTGYPIVCPIHDVEANMGDVMLAGIGTGLLSYDDVKKWQVLDDKIMPNQENHRKYNDYYKVYKSIYQNLKTDMKTLTSISVR
ncbi:FGGY-family carbohydrate kinase [Niallia taxi]|uniref:FGGY-family carbohydrate kinase n=1 Tax=Niallia taxi TaxID=2499688 RepID=UPI0011A037ED|nr:FGGY-family carbohydrate kinase [Niallia taxi]MCT2344485.1 FGGY-family carbohydrate kinase [Niallia taxi]MDE5054307.1 FGGY-family carbohydrate kinase [Niallia taxi]MED3961047.1 FGGY-family carbohydrate kinase [Niallia taxi]WOD65096.1 FGGY-family carbohydrate kinase [Niallia taxi]